MLYFKPMTIHSLIFDFDGLILDTETPELDAWKSIYIEHGFEYPLELAVQNVGLWGVPRFDPAEHLHELSHNSLDIETLRTRHREESNALVLRKSVMAGVVDIISSAQKRGLRLAIASSSERWWVESHLSRLGLIQHFNPIVCGDDVPPGRTKPHPDIYLKALSLLQIRADQAIALEDSSYGVAAAHAAGIFVVAALNPATALVKMEHADLTVDSLAHVSLERILGQMIARQGQEEHPHLLSEDSEVGRLVN